MATRICWVDQEGITVECPSCGRSDHYPLDNDGADLGAPCGDCGSRDKRVRVLAHETRASPDYLVVKAKRADGDRSLPEKGNIRLETGRRIGRDGRLVSRSARYDPYSDVAEERVVDVASGEVVVDKSESMKEKVREAGTLEPASTLRGAEDVTPVGENARSSGKSESEPPLVAPGPRLLPRQGGRSPGRSSRRPLSAAEDSPRETKLCGAERRPG